MSAASRRAVRPSPVFLGVLAVTFLGGVLAWSGAGRTSPPADVGVFLFVLAGWVASLCLHEFAHAYTAYRAGDRSVETAGYLTLNPFRYVHPLLSIVLPLFFIIQGGIGLPGGAVYLHRHAFRSRLAQSLAAAVGPATNAVLAVVLLGLAQAQPVGSHPQFWGAVGFLGFLQITAAVLNLMPIPGLDGYAIIEAYLGEPTRTGFEGFKPWGMLAVIALLQVRQINDRFFDVVFWFYDLTGAPRILYSLGYFYFRFWTH